MKKLTIRVGDIIGCKCCNARFTVIGITRNGDYLVDGTAYRVVRRHAFLISPLTVEKIAGRA